MAIKRMKMLQIINEYRNVIGLRDWYVGSPHKLTRLQK